MNQPLPGHTIQWITQFAALFHCQPGEVYPILDKKRVLKVIYVRDRGFYDPYAHFLGSTDLARIR